MAAASIKWFRSFEPQTGWWLIEIFLDLLHHDIDMFFLLHVAPDRMLMAAATNNIPVFEADTSSALFQTAVYGPSIVRSRNNYVVGPKENTFIINSVVDSRQPIHVVVGWNTP